MARKFGSLRENKTMKRPIRHPVAEHHTWKTKDDLATSGDFSLAADTLLLWKDEAGTCSAK